MEWDSGTTTASVAELFVRTALPNFREPEFDKNCNDLGGFQNRYIAHVLRNSNVLYADKLSLKLRLAVFKKHADDFLKVSVELIKGLCLRVSSRESRYKAHE